MPGRGENGAPWASRWRSGGSYQNMRLRSTVERLWDDLDVAIEDTHRRHEQGEQAWRRASGTPYRSATSMVWPASAAA